MQPKLAPGVQQPAARRPGSRKREKVRAPGAGRRGPLAAASHRLSDLRPRRVSCTLQDYHFKPRAGRSPRRPGPFTSRRRDRCGDVHCSLERCILYAAAAWRFAAEVSGTRELMPFVGHGAGEEIDVPAWLPPAHNLSGNVVRSLPRRRAGRQGLPLSAASLVPPAAGRSVCTGCAAGCSVWVEENQDRIYRLKPREEPAVEQVVDLQRRPLRAIITSTTRGGCLLRGCARTERPRRPPGRPARPV